MSSEQCKIRITSRDYPNVSATSDTFEVVPGAIIPDITGTWICTNMVGTVHRHVSYSNGDVEDAYWDYEGDEHPSMMIEEAALSAVSAGWLWAEFYDTYSDDSESIGNITRTSNGSFNGTTLHVVIDERIFPSDPTAADSALTVHTELTLSWDEESGILEGSGSLIISGLIDEGISRIDTAEIHSIVFRKKY